MTEAPLPTIMDGIIRDAAEHEIFLSFVNDTDAVLWHEWWTLHGQHEFAAFVENTKHRNDDAHQHYN